MQKVTLIDRLSAEWNWEINDPEVDLFVEQLKSSNKYGLPDEVTITVAPVPEPEERPSYTCAEVLAQHDPVYYKGSAHTSEVWKFQATFDNLTNPFNSRNIEVCPFGERGVLAAYIHPYGHLCLISGSCGEQIEWSEPFEMEGNPSSFYIAPYGEGQFILIATEGEANAGMARIGTPGEEEWEMGPWSQFSTEALCSDMTCQEIFSGGVIAVSYKDGTDGLGYTRIGHVSEVDLSITWDVPYCHGITESFENRLCDLGWAEEGERIFSIFYRRAVGSFKGYMRVLGYQTEGGGFVVKSDEVVCAPVFCKNMRPTHISGGEGCDIRVAMAYLDNDSGGNGMVCIGNLLNISTPVFNPMNVTVVNPGLTSSLAIYGDPGTMNETFYMMWIDHTKGNRTEFGHYYFENDKPMSNIGERVIDYWPALTCHIIGFRYEGFMDTFMLFTVDQAYGDIETYSFVTGETGLAYFHALGGFAHTAGAIGEEIKVDLFGDVVDRASNHDTLWYLDRSAEVSGNPSPFPIALGLNNSKVLYTKTAGLG